MNKIVKIINEYESIPLGFLMGVSISLIEKGMTLVGILSVICSILLFIAKFGRLFNKYDNNMKGGKE